MRMLIVLCLIGLVGVSLASPGLIRERMSRGFRGVKNGPRIKRPLNPLLMARHPKSKSMKPASHTKELACELCPPPNDIIPCSCSCECNTTMCFAKIQCDSTLETASDLQRVLSQPSYPVRNYSSLLVENTFLDGAITRSLLGTTVSFKEININHNGFNYVDKNAFNNTGHTLRRLILNHNEILYFDWTLNDMPNIQYIDISNNRLTFIPSDAMHSKNLCFINFSHNDLPDIGAAAFRGLPKLTHLDLSYNALMKLSTNLLSFKNREDIHLGINLSHNHIASVEPNAISGVSKLSVDLRYNELETLKEDVFRNLIDSTDANIHIDVTGNPIACNCKLYWVVQNSTVSNCFDDFTVCGSTIRNITAENLGDCTQYTALVNLQNSIALK